MPGYAQESKSRSLDIFKDCFKHTCIHTRFAGASKPSGQTEETKGAAAKALAKARGAGVGGS